MSKNNSRKSFCFPGSIADCPFCTSGASWGSCSAGKCASPVNEAWRKAVDRWQHSNGKSRHLSLPVVSLRDARSACRLYQPVEFLISWSLRLVKYNTDFRLIHFKRKAIWMPCRAANASPYSWFQRQDFSLLPWRSPWSQCCPQLWSTISCIQTPRQGSSSRSLPRTDISC